MKLKSLKLNNFTQFTDFEIEYGDKITKLIGMNGSGKTTVGLNAIWACIKGVSEKNSNGQLIGERFRFIGSDGKSANIELTLIDTKKNAEIKVTNHITKTSNQIKFDAPDDYQIDNDWLNELLSVSLMSAKNFTELDGKSQALLLGIDTNAHDEQIESIKSEFTLLNRDLKNLGKVESVEEVKSESISDLIDELTKTRNRNNEIDSITRELQNEVNFNADCVDKISDLTYQIDASTTRIRKLKDSLVGKEKQPTSQITEKIANSEKTNEKAREYEEYQKWLSKYSKASFKITSNREALKKKENARLNYIKSFDFEIKGLSVDDKGSLLLNDRPIKPQYFSKGELELIVAKLHASSNPDFKVRFIDDFELLDEDNQVAIVDSLLKHGFQIITAEVGKEKKEDNSILLRQCSIGE